MKSDDLITHPFCLFLCVSQHFLEGSHWQRLLQHECTDGQIRWHILGRRKKWDLIRNKSAEYHFPKIQKICYVLEAMNAHNILGCNTSRDAILPLWSHLRAHSSGAGPRWDLPIQSRQQWAAASSAEGHHDGLGWSTHPIGEAGELSSINLDGGGKGERDLAVLC